MNLFEELQLLFWRTVLQAPKNMSKVMLRAYTSSQQMKQRIWKMKLMLAQSILKEDTSLAKSVYQEALRMGWTGLSTDVKKVCGTIGIKNINKHLEKKDTIEDAIFYHSYKELNFEINKYKQDQRS